ncbi:MAG: protein kinase, partial [Geobacteraceae bacterium]|nr:protein kinase [Geobacteraceae bacterium]
MNIPGYQIERELGHGGMSTVYLAVQESLGRQVALKVMAPALAADRSFGERFLREARTVAQLTHQNILAVYDIGSIGHSYYLAMEY